MSSMLPAFLGFRAHTGWAAMVALAGPFESPKVIDRRRLELSKGGDEQPAAVYHAASKLSLDAAEKLVRKVIEDAHRQAHAALRSTIDDLRAKGYRIAASAIVCGKARLPATLEAILSSHPLVHAAEGELFRQALASASEAFKLSVTTVQSGDLYPQLASALGINSEDLRRRLAEAGRSIGKPWAQDQKEAMSVAWVALASMLQPHRSTPP